MFVHLPESTVNHLLSRYFVFHPTDYSDKGDELDTELAEALVEVEPVGCGAIEVDANSVARLHLSPLVQL